MNHSRVVTFFCSFSFFEQHQNSNYPFAAATIFLPKLQVAVKNSSCTLVINKVVDADVDVNHILQDIQNKIRTLQSLTNGLPIAVTTRKGSQTSQINNPDVFKNSVLSALQKIEAKQLRKNCFGRHIRCIFI